jgi:hypothetical protein
MLDIDYAKAKLELIIERQEGIAYQGNPSK